MFFGIRFGTNCHFCSEERVVLHEEGTSHPCAQKFGTSSNRKRPESHSLQRISPPVRGIHQHSGIARHTSDALEAKVTQGCPHSVDAEHFAVAHRY